MSNNFRLILAFGSNQGDREQNFAVTLKYLRNLHASVEILQQGPYLETVPFESSVYQTQNQENYLNFVCEVVTPLYPNKFYREIIVPIEDQLGHSRKKKWEPRALDIDILLAALNNQNDFNNCTPIVIADQDFFLPHKDLLAPERIVIKNMLKTDLNLKNECIECHFKQYLLEKK